MRLKPLTSVDHVYVTASMTRPEAIKSAGDLARLHRTQGYSKIACHYVIERSGVVVEGRYPTEPGALAGKKYDATSHQIVLIGGVNEALEPEDNFTEEQHLSLARLLAEYPGQEVVYSPDFPRN